MRIRVAQPSQNAPDGTRQRINAAQRELLLLRPVNQRCGRFSCARVSESPDARCLACRCERTRLQRALAFAGEEDCRGQSHEALSHVARTAHYASEALPGFSLKGFSLKAVARDRCHGVRASCDFEPCELRDASLHGQGMRHRFEFLSAIDIFYVRVSPVPGRTQLPTTTPLSLRNLVEMD